MRNRGSALLVGAFMGLSLGCGEESEPGTPSSGGWGGETSQGGQFHGGGNGGTAAGGGAEAIFRISAPAPDSTVLGSTNVLVEVQGLGLSNVQFELQGAGEVLCDDADAAYSCLVDLSGFAPDTIHTITASGLLDGAVVASDSVTVARVPAESEICKDDQGQDQSLVTCLDALATAGEAAGNGGDQYDNRDGDHTSLNTSNHPQVTYLHLGYGSPGLGSSPENQDPTTPLVGNASLCSDAGAGWCEGQVHYMLRFGAASTFYDLYVGSNFYWFPEHTDHDERDRAFYMVPFTNSSQGSSGSEMDEVEKWLYTLAAFRPDTKAALETSGTLMPTIQMLYRRTRVATDGAYLSAEAHANAFDDVSNAHAMVRMAHLLTPEVLPPMVQLAVVAEDWTASEVAFTTPVSIARHWAGDTATPRRLVVSAASSFDPNGLPLSYHWVVIRRSDAITITPQAPDGSVVELQFTWHDEETIQIGAELRTTTLAVVAAFVHNGRYFSAPAFVTSSTE